jgi:hypothetical protein
MAQAKGKRAVRGRQRIVLAVLSPHLLHATQTNAAQVTEGISAQINQLLCCLGQTPEVDQSSVTFTNDRSTLWRDNAGNDSAVATGPSVQPSAGVSRPSRWFRLVRIHLDCRGGKSRS